MGEEGFKVFCVEKDGSKGEQGASESMLEARKSLKSDGFKPEWISQSECLNVKQKIKNCVYLFDTFGGKSFKHIKGLGFRILGPLCILTSTKYKMDIPRRSSPVFNLAMKDVVICCTNLDKTRREEIHEKVELMGGSVSKDFTEFVTHLIAGEVGSKKYQVAASMGKRIMLPKWVDEVWAATQEQHIPCTDEQFEDAACPIFLGLVLTVSGLDTEERNQIKKLIEAEGGKYSGEMKINECTHLIINKPKGAKYGFAKKWKINIVKSDWLYDSVEKGFCLDENKYKLEEDNGKDDKSQVKTSTPEKEGATSNRMSTIGDISCISSVSEVQLTHLNETSASACTTFQRKSLIDVELSVNAIDLSKQPADLFLDGCKIYLSGFKGPAMDKLRKVINAGGGTRLNQLNENVTHVVIGERMDKDIETLKTSSFRPHVVTAMWLAECYRQGSTVGEEAFQSPELPPLDPESPKLKGKKKSITKPITPPTQVQKPSESAMDEFSDIMSQYLLQADQGVSGSKDDTVVNNAPAAATEADQEEEDTTQDLANQSEAGEGKIFNKKVFMFFGFEEEPEKELTEYITERGGKVSGQMSRVVPDFGVVPIDGFPVSRTVKDIVTNAWLQMCLEQDTLLDINSNQLFTPIDIVSDGLPLQGCVLSVSGYSGTERDCLMHIADLMGAECQEYFVRKASKGLKASTHLVVKEADGSKYHAAKKWGIPAISNRWLFACARSGKREDEGKYLVDAEVQSAEISDDKQTSSEPSKTSRKSDHNEAAKLSTSMNKQAGEQDISGVNGQMARTDADRKSENHDSTIEFKNKDYVPCDHRDMDDADVTLPNGADVNNTSHNGETTDDTKSKSSSIYVITKDQELGDSTHSGLSPGAGVGVNTSQGVASSSGQKNFPESQKENVVETKNTPKLQNHRVKELQNDELPTPKSSSRKSIVNSPSPGRFMDPSREFKPRFDLDDVMKALESPAGQQANQRKTGKRKSSLPLEELFSHHIAAAAKYTENYTMGETDEVDGTTSYTYQEQRGPLKDVIIAVSKKLSSQQAEMNNIVDALGGDYRWQYDSSCTHFIFQGRTNDTSKEFRTARDQKKIIVSPHWIYMCKEQNARVDESLFPHNYNPNLTLSVVSSRKSGTPARGTPARGTRKSARTVSTTSVKPTSLELTETDSKQRSEVTTEQVEQKVDKKGTQRDESEALEKEQTGATNAEDPEPEGVEMAGTLDIREEFTKQLETMMAASKSKKTNRRRSKRLNLSGHNSTSGESPGEAHNGSSNHSRSGSRSNRWMLEDEEKNSKTSGRTENKDADSNSLPEASQSVQVMWDDPTGRMEQEKLAHKLQRACSPTQDVMNCDVLDAQFSDIEDEAGDEDAEVDAPDSKTDKETAEDRVPTPEAPSLAFPMSRQSKGADAQVIDVDDDEDEEEEVQMKPPPVFIFSGMSQEEKDHYGGLVETLGGRVLDGLHYDPSCTHLIIGAPSRNEKFLACVASGKWVLHKSYLEACREESKFVQEDLYEWGGEGTAGLMEKMSSQVKKLAQAACRWRLTVLYQESQSAAPCQGAFSGWKVILSTDKSKEGNFRRLLEAGGATVLNIKPPFTDSVKATHAFVELNKVPLSEDDLKNLVMSKVTCVKPDFIAAHLMENPPPSPEDFYPTEVKTLVTSMYGGPSAKRKQSSSTTEEKTTKRLRRK